MARQALGRWHRRGSPAASTAVTGHAGNRRRRGNLQAAATIGGDRPRETEGTVVFPASLCTAKRCGIGGD
ncbi:hypothetical protein GCM10023214_28720 [Amycolatopsis dongchuanensis]|uniref:Uncharacterized protein n=1 Tax=Amycolatopsis dongchuanensis TaxID=1070866 RepID=A0ABP9QI31_9PSEU